MVRNYIGPEGEKDLQDAAFYNKVSLYHLIVHKIKIVLCSDSCVLSKCDDEAHVSDYIARRNDGFCLLASFHIKINVNL